MLNALPSALRRARAFATRLCTLSVAFALASVSASGSQARADTLTWTGAGDGIEFSDPANWSPQVTPSAVHDCIIPAGAADTIRATGVFSIRSLDSSRDLWVSSCSTFTLKAGLTLHDGAKFSIIGNCTGLVLDGGTQTISGDGRVEILTNSSAPTIDIINGAQVTVGAGITVIYAANAIGPAASVSVGSGASLVNLGTIHARKSPGTLTLKGSGQFINMGTMLAEYGSLKLQFPNWSSSGTIAAKKGGLVLGNTWSSTGAIVLEDSSNVSFSGNWTSSGPITVNSSTLLIEGTWVNSGGVTLIDATWLVRGTATSLGAFTRSGNCYIDIGARLSAPEIEATDQTGTLIFTNATLVGTTLRHTSGPGFTIRITTFDGCTIASDIDISTCSVMNGLTLSGGVRVRMTAAYSTSGFTFIGGAQSVRGNGSIIWDPSVISVACPEVTIEPGVTLEFGPSATEAVVGISPGSRLTLQSGLVVPAGKKLSVTGGGTFINNAAIQASAATLNMTVSAWTNFGTITLTDCVWNVAGSWSNAGLITLANSTWNLGGTYAGFGNISRTGGVINFGGTFAGASLVANAESGDITLKDMTVQGATLTASGGAKFNLVGSVTFRNCTVGASIAVDPCVTLRVENDLAIDSQCELVVRTTTSCTNGGLVFAGGLQSISGSGRIVLNPDGPLAAMTPMRLLSNASVSIGSQISLVRGNGATDTIFIENGAKLVSAGTIQLSGTGRVAISGGDFASSGTLDVGSSSLTIAKLVGGAGTIIMTPGASLTIAGDYQFDQAVHLPQNAKLTLTGVGEINSPMSLDAGASLSANGQFLIQANIDALDASIDLAGSWSNSAHLAVTGGSLVFKGSWSNAGQLDVSGAAWTIGGSYTSLGSFTSSANALTYRDSYPGFLLQADVTTGDITLDQITLSSVALRSRDGARIRVISGITLNSCPLDGILYLTKCGSATLSTGISLASGSRIEIDSASCSTAALQFLAGAQSISGSGEIVALQGDVLRIRNNSAVTIEEGIAIRTDVGVNQSSLVVDSGSLVTNLGLLSSRQPNRSLVVTGALKNQGVLESLAGTLGVNGAFTNQGLLKALGGGISIGSLQGNLGSVEITPPGSLLVSGTSYTVDQPISVAAGSKLTLSGSYSINAPIESTGGELALSGNYIVDHDLSLIGGKLTLDGAWTNKKTVIVRNAALTFAGTWSNLGTFDVSSSAWTIGGTYTSLGNSIASGNSMTYSGAFPGTFLRADSSTGDITLKGASLNSATLQCADGAKFRTAPGTTNSALSGCTIDGELVVGNCTSLNIASGITLLNGSRLVLDNPFCAGSIIFTNTPSQSVLGDGEIVFKGVGSSAPIQTSSVSLIFGSGITLRYPADAVGHTNITVTLSPSRAMTVAGTLSVERPDGLLTISGSGIFSNAGTVRAAGGTLVLSSQLSNVVGSGFSRTITGGKWHAVGGKLTISSLPPTVIAAGTEVVVQGGSLNGFASIRENYGTYKLSGGSFGPFSRNRGTLELGPGTFVSASSLTLEPAGTVIFAVKGTAPGDFPRMQSNPVVAQQGALRVRFESPYIPQAGDVIGPVFTSTAFYYGFNSVCTDANPANLGVSLFLNTSAAPATMSLVVSPDTGLSPVVTLQPIDASASPHAKFTVAGAPLDVAVQWRRNGVPIADGPTGHGSVISGSGDFTLIVTNAAIEDVGSYDAALSNSCATTFSNPAALRLCTGDLNGDAMVDDSDFLIFLAAYNLLDCAGPAMPALCPGDFNSDGMVDDADFTLFIPAYDALLCP